MTSYTPVSICDLMHPFQSNSAGPLTMVKLNLKTKSLKGL